MRKRLVFSMVLGLGLLIALALPLAPPAAAQGGQPGRLVLGAQYTLESGETMVGDLAVIGGQAVIEEGATVDGDVVVLGGSLAVSGRIDGDIAIFGGEVDLRRSAVVDGDILTFGGSISQAPGAEVTGEVKEGGAVDIPGTTNTLIYATYLGGTNDEDITPQLYLNVKPNRLPCYLPPAPCALRPATCPLRLATCALPPR